MTRALYFISHPDVVVDKDVPITKWRLSEVGRSRMLAGLGQPWVRGVTSIFCSTEQKAIDGAEILARHVGLPFRQVEALGENDRSATGFLPPPEFEAVADAFFAQPQQSVRGWERAADAQRRIVSAVLGIANGDMTAGSMAIVSHGAVGTLLHSWLSGRPISREWDQPPGGGNFYRFQLRPPMAHGRWQAFDGVPVDGPALRS